MLLSESTLVEELFYKKFVYMRFFAKVIKNSIRSRKFHLLVKCRKKTSQRIIIVISLVWIGNI